MPRKRTLFDAFWPNVAVGRKDECWEWQSYLVPRGYGRAKAGGQRIYAHRASWILNHGPIPDGLSVLHRCDNRKCVNPYHLFLGTQTDNMQDMNQKGRHAQGSTHPIAKLTEEEVAEIKLRLAAGEPHMRIAPDYRVSASTIDNIAAGRIWRHVHVGVR